MCMRMCMPHKQGPSLYSVGPASTCMCLCMCHMCTPILKILKSFEGIRALICKTKNTLWKIPQKEIRQFSISKNLPFSHEEGYQHCKAK